MRISKIAEVPDVNVRRFDARIIQHNRLSESGYELVLERNDLRFDAGRLVTLHGRNETEDRSYTIASGERDEHLHILYRLVPEGVLTPQLVGLRSGQTVPVSGPFGQFVLRDAKRPVYFIATGTGVAPCRAYVRTHPELDLTLVHGVRTESELHYRDLFEPYRYHPCLSRETGRGFQGRVTDFLADQSLSKDAHYYLCGAYEMIYDVQALLTDKGVPADHLFTEGYYYRLET